ncbi:hypothetical protein KUCAC02_029753, partial [Chaenocephalus aceratus]
LPLGDLCLKCIPVSQTSDCIYFCKTEQRPPAEAIQQMVLFTPSEHFRRVS